MNYGLRRTRVTFAGVELIYFNAEEGADGEPAPATDPVGAWAAAAMAEGGA